MFTFHYADGSCSLASHIALEHVGAPYVAVRVDFANKQQRSDAYLALNPKGRVPTLVTPRGILTETPAILQFIAQSFPHAGLAPLYDVFELAHMNAFNSYLCSTVHVARAHGRRGERWADDAAAIEAMKKKAPQNVLDCFALIEREYLAGPWLLGERYTVSDMYLFTFTNWSMADGLELSRYPKLHALHHRMLKDPVVSKVLTSYR